MAMTQATPAPRQALPKTSSEFPTIAAAGALSLMAGLALARRRRVA
jgi:LPXTG-motif cell wall-anchored protein